MMKKHILFIVENSTIPYDPRVYFEALTVKENGYDVSIICPIKGQALKRYEKIEEINVYRHPIPKDSNKKIGLIIEYLISFLWEIYLSLKIFLKKPFHIIHIANPPDHLFVIAIIFKFFGVKFIFDHHDLSPECYLTKFKRKDIFYFILTLFENLTFKTADIIIATNESYKKIAINRGKTNPDKVFVVRNGPNISKIGKITKDNKIKNGFKHVVGYVGGIGVQDRLDILLKVIEYLVFEKKLKNVKFLIIGDGPAKNELVETAKLMRIDKFLHFTGFIKWPYFYNLLAATDVCVNPEYCDEYTDKSTMIKIMDYMLCGKPIVQFKTTEGKYSAGQAAINVNGYGIHKFADAIIYLLNEPELRKKMGDIGKQRLIDHLQWEIQKVNLIKAYTTLFNFKKNKG